MSFPWATVNRWHRPGCGHQSGRSVRGHALGRTSFSIRPTGEPGRCRQPRWTSHAKGTPQRPNRQRVTSGHRRRAWRSSTQEHRNDTHRSSAVAVRLLYLIFRQVLAWLGLSARSAQSKKRNPRASTRSRRARPPGTQTATVLGGPGSVCRRDPVVVPSRSRASDCHPGPYLAVAPGLGEATQDPAPTSPHQRPAHRIRITPGQRRS